MLYIIFYVYNFLKFVVNYLEFFELLMTCFVRIARVRSVTPRLMWNDALRIGGRDGDFEPCFLCFMKMCILPIDASQAILGPDVNLKASHILGFIFSGAFFQILLHNQPFFIGSDAMGFEVSAMLLKTENTIEEN